MIRAIKGILFAVALGMAFSQTLFAQSVVTVTNVVTVMVTNIVTVTNIVVAVPPQEHVKVLVKAKPVAPLVPVKYPWQSSVSAGFTLTRGNSQTMLFSADFLTSKKKPADEYTLGLGLAYGTQNSEDTVNNYKGFAQWNHLFSDRFYAYARTDALRDIVADLDYRLTFGPGAGYYLIKETNTTLAVEAGCALEFQKLGDDSETFATARLAERFEHKFKDRARVWQNIEFLPQVDQFDNYVINLEVGLEAAISKSFSLKTYVDDSYENRPAVNHYKNDAKIVAGVSYKF